MYAYDFPEVSSLKRVGCIFHFFGEGPKFAVAQEYICNIICIACSDFDQMVTQMRQRGQVT